MTAQAQSISQLPFSAALIVTASLYWRGWRRLHKDLPNVVSVWRLAAFTGGLACVWVAVASPLAALDHHLLVAHMAQHLLLMTVAAPLILIGAPVAVLLPHMPRGFRCAPLHAVGRWIAHPAFCWLAATAVVWRGMFPRSSRSA